ncbi:hypothetical protein [Bartonella schoenbuchensis]|uniref:hypothetical protein n=1 Tax=Bartonella schoenbuchensis TaxID=165694 RepID=UPI00314522AB
MMNMENVCVGGNKFRGKTEKHVENNESGKTATLQGIYLLSQLCLGKQLTDEELASIRPKIGYFNKGIILSAKISVDEAEIEKLAKLNTLKKIKDDFSESN